MGLKPFLLSMDPYFEESLSFLTKVFLGREVERTAFAHDSPVAKTIPERWIKFFGLDGVGYNPATLAMFSTHLRKPWQSCAYLNLFSPTYSKICSS